MCRLAAWSGPAQPPSQLVFGGAHSLARQSWDPRELLSGSVNADGWAVVWFADQGPVRLADDRPVWHATDLERLLGSMRSPLIMAAVRNGTTGLPYGEAGVAPLLRGGIALMLNGFVEHFRTRHIHRWLSRLSAETVAEMVGVSDTELLLLLVLEEMRQGASLRSAISRVVSTVLEEATATGSEAQLTLVASAGSGFVATRTSNRARSNSLYWLAEPGGGLTLASEALDQRDGWTPVAHGSLIEVGSRGTPPSIEAAFVGVPGPAQDEALSSP